MTDQIVADGVPEEFRSRIHGMLMEIRDMINILSWVDPVNVEATVGTIEQKVEALKLEHGQYIGHPVTW